jgi:hypothetical protein
MASESNPILNVGYELNRDAFDIFSPTKRILPVNHAGQKGRKIAVVKVRK